MTVSDWPDINTAGMREIHSVLYQQLHLPVDYTADIFDALDIQDELQTLYFGNRIPCIPWRKTSGLEEQQHHWYGRLQRTIDCHTIRSHRLIPYVRNMAILRRALSLSELWKEGRGLQSYHRILPSGTELEHRIKQVPCFNCAKQ